MSRNSAISKDYQVSLYQIPTNNGKSLNELIVNYEAYDVASGNTDIYTCPVGKKALVAPSASIVNSSGVGSIVASLQVKDSSNYYKIAPSLTLPNSGATSVNRFSIPSLILVAGQSLAINCDQSGLSIRGYVIEVDDSLPIDVFYNYAVGSGNTTIYTCPSGKKAAKIFSLASTNDRGVAGFNSNASATVLSIYNVPSGDSPSSANQISASVSISANTAVGGNGNSAFTMASGDSIVVNNSTANALSLWGGVILYDN